MVELRPKAPPRVASTSSIDPTLSYPAMVPGHLIMAVPEDLRTSPDALHIEGLKAAKMLSVVLNTMEMELGQTSLSPGFSISTRFSRLREYLGRELQQVLAKSKVLGRVRLELVEKVSPMSLHVGVIRIGDGAAPLLDILFDTTDSDTNLPVFAYVAFAPVMVSLLVELIQAGFVPASALVQAC